MELGSLCGLSSRFLAQHAPNATIICIDHWEGSAEHVGRAGHKPEWKERLKELYPRFLRNLWPHRHHVVPMKTTTLDGMQELHGLGIQPEVIYIDASHDTDSVRGDISMAWALFPDAHLVGDDWGFPTVRMGLMQATSIKPTIWGTKAWHLKPKGRVDD